MLHFLTVLAVLALMSVQVWAAPDPVASAARGPGGSGGTDGYVIVNAGSANNVYPFWAGATSCRFQMLYLESEINQAGHITWFAFQNADTNRVTFNNLTIKLCETPMSEITVKMDSNYGFQTPVTVFGPATRTIGTGVVNGWDSIPISFDYENGKNLLVEVIWNGTPSGSVSSFYGKRPPARRTYVWDWQGNIGANVDSSLYNARFTFLDHDVSCAALTAPTGTLDSGASVVPACSVFNDGVQAETFNVCMRIGTTYDETTTVSNLPRSSRGYVTFANWTALGRGGQTVSCSTELAGDAVPDNDRRLDSVFVRVRDVGSVALIAPGPIVDSGTSVVPACSIANFGSTTESYPVVMRIGGIYVETTQVAAQSPGARGYVTWPTWVAPARGTYAVTCSTGLAGDLQPDDDRLTASTQVSGHDLGVVAIIAPSRRIRYGWVTPRAVVHNYGSMREPGKVFFRIDAAPVYLESLVFDGGVPFADTALSFPTWLATTGSYAARCSTFLATDQTPVNDTLSLVFSVAVLETNWVRKADVPLGPKNKKVKDGGSLALGDSALIFALKGNNTVEFYDLNTATNSWTAHESVPVLGSTGKKRRIKKGATLVQAAGSFYATKGGATYEFWRYSPALATGQPGTGTGRSGAAPGLTLSYPWTEVAPVPVGAKPVKEGTGSVAASLGDMTFIYFLKGSGTYEFYRYNTLSNVWEIRTPAPAGMSGKPFKIGSCMTSDGAGTIYALKGSYNELYAYSCSTDVWTTRTGLPLVGRLGKKKRAKAGASMAWREGMLYVTKGGSTQEFWSLDATLDHWTQLQDFPLGDGKAVKGGASMVYSPVEDGLFATKGNSTFEFWKYGFPPARQPTAITSPDVPVVGSGGVRNLELQVAPNPSRGAVTISYFLTRPGPIRLKLYDVTGKSVSVLAKGRQNPGHSSIILRPSALPCGVYLVKLEGEGSAVSRKLVVE